MALSGNDLKIVVGAQLSTKEAKEALNNFVKTSSQTKVVFNTEIDENGFKKIEKIYRTLNKYIDEQGNLLETTTHQRKLANGKLSEENGIITKVVEGYKKLSNAQKESFKDSDLVNKKVTKITDGYGRLVTIIEKYNKEGNKFKQVITEQKTAYGETIKTIDEYIGEEEKLQRHYVEEVQDLDKRKKAQEEYNASLEKAVKLRESHTYRTYNKNDKRYENVTVETITDEYENKVKTITREYETLAGTVKIVSQQTKDLGKAWSEEQKISEEVVSNEIKSVQKLYEETVKYKNAKGQIVTRTTSKDSEGNWHSTITKEYIESGKKVQETTEYIKKQGEAWKTEGETSKKVVNDELARDKELKKSREDALNQLVREKEAIRKRNEEWKKANTYTTNYKDKEKEVLNLRDKTIHKLQTETKEIKDKTGAVKTITTLSDKWVDSQGMLHTKLTETTKTVNKYGKEVGKATTKITENVEKSRTGLNQLGQSFSDIIVKVAKFYLASLPIRALQTAITSAIQSVKDFDSALTEFKKVSDLSGESLTSYTKKLEQLGKETARTRTEMVEMSTQFRKSGFTDDNEVAQLANVAALYQNIADEELSAADASSVLISQIKAFQKEGVTAEQVVDAINETANRNAVSTSDIGRGLTQAGAALSTYGNTFYETIALVTAGTEIFQNRSQQVARGLNTVASRIAKNEKALQKYGVEIYDENNNLKSTYQILSELSPKWDEMSNAEQVALGTTLAGY